MSKMERDRKYFIKNLMSGMFHYLRAIVKLISYLVAKILKKFFFASVTLPFIINPDTGYVSTSHSLDRELQHKYILTVEVRGYTKGTEGRQKEKQQQKINNNSKNKRNSDSNSNGNNS